MSRRRPGGTAGRDVHRLLRDFGHELPAAAAEDSPEKGPKIWVPASVRGEFRANRGWSPAKAPVAQYQMTSDQAPALWPWITAPGVPPRGAEIGIDLQSKSTFYSDPFGWVIDDQIPVTNPNIMNFGAPGRGKSATSKVFISRMLDFGYRAFISGDPKDEYESLCRLYGVSPFSIGIGMGARINPLDIGPLGQGWETLPPAEAIKRSQIIFSRWLVLLRGLIGSQKIGSQAVPYGPNEEEVIGKALADLTGFAGGSTTLVETTIPKLWDRLNDPTRELIADSRYRDKQHFWDETRLLRNALGQLVNGALAGLFDGHTNIKVDWDAPIQSLSLSRLKPLGDEAVGVALTCLNSWSRGMREMAAPGDKRVIMRDEVWMQMRLGVDAVKSFDADLRFSRTDGDIQFANAHKPSDWPSAGDAGSQAQMIASDLMSLADIKILHGQESSIAEELDDLLDLGPMATELMTKWGKRGKGRALWCLGNQIHQVQTVLHPLEAEMTYTNEAIA